MFKNIILAGFLALPSFFVWAEVPQNNVKEEVNIYRQVYDARFVTTSGNTTTLRKLAQEKPLILALIFTRCSDICYPFLLRLKEDLQFDGQPGDFNVAVISFDARDSLADMKRLAESFGLDKEPGWFFGTTNDIDSLNRSIGFEPVWDTARAQFDHDALLTGINTDGYITKKLIGIRSSKDLSLLVRSINNEFSPTYRLPGQNLLFSCFNYDPRTGKTTPGTGLLFLALPAVLTIAFVGGIRLMVGRKK